MTRRNRAEPETSERTRATGVLALFAATLFLVPSRFSAGGYGPLTATTVVGLLLALLWVAGRTASTLTTQRRRPTAVGLAVALFMALMGLSYAWANAQPITGSISQGSTRNLMVLGVLSCIAFAASDLLRSRVDLERVLVVAVGAAGIMALIALVQFTTGVDVASWLKPPGFTTNKGTSFIIERGGLPHVMGTARHPIEFTVLCAAMIPVGIYLATRGGSRGVRLMSGTSTIAMLLALPMGFSRTGLVALVVVLVFMVPVVSSHMRGRVTAAGLLVLLALAFAFPQVVSGVDDLRTGEVGAGSVEGRAEHRKISLGIASDSPLIGHGFGTWNTDERGFVVDNGYVVLLVETGWIGVSAFIGLFVAAVSTMRAVRRRAADAPTRELAQALTAAFVGLTVSGWGFHILRYSAAAALTFLLFGVAAALANLTRVDQGRFTHAKEPQTEHLLAAVR